MNRVAEPRGFGVRECLTFLRSASLGRLVFTERALPAIQPVNFVVAGEHVIIWSGLGGAVASIHQEVVAFEVDQIDAASHTGWSVVVLGKAEIVSDPTRRQLTADEPNKVIRVHIDRIYGRRLCLNAMGELPLRPANAACSSVTSGSDQNRAYQPSQSRLEGDR